MSTLVKSAVLSLSLLAGAAVSAYAQSDKIAALPPNAAATPAPQGAVIAPSPAYVGPGSGDHLERPGEADPAGRRRRRNMSVRLRGSPGAPRRSRPSRCSHPRNMSVRS